MSDEPVSAIEKETTPVVLATFAEAYRLEIGAEEDVYRTFPFFGTALGIVIAAIGYAAGRLTPWGELRVHWLFLASSGLLALAALESIGVIFRLSQALARRDYQRIGPERVLRERLEELRAYYDDLVEQAPNRDALLARDFQEALIASYERVTPLNRGLNDKRYHYRALAASHLVRSLLWALGGTAVIFVSDKIGLLPRISP
jgi:hypothetical protein